MAQVLSNQWIAKRRPHWDRLAVLLSQSDASGLGQLMKTRQQMVDLGYAPDAGPAVMYFLTSRLSNSDIAELQLLIPRKDLVEAWRDI